MRLPYSCCRAFAAKISGETIPEILLEKAGTESCREVLVGALSKLNLRSRARLAGSSFSVSSHSPKRSCVEAGGILPPGTTRRYAQPAINCYHGITLARMLDERLRPYATGARQFVDALAVAGVQSIRKLSIRQPSFPVTSCRWLAHCGRLRSCALEVRNTGSSFITIAFATLCQPTGPTK